MLICVWIRLHRVFIPHDMLSSMNQFFLSQCLLLSNQRTNHYRMHLLPPHTFRLLLLSLSRCHLHLRNCQLQQPHHPQTQPRLPTPRLLLRLLCVQHHQNSPPQHQTLQLRKLSTPHHQLLNPSFHLWHLSPHRHLHARVIVFGNRSRSLTSIPPFPKSHTRFPKPLLKLSKALIGVKP